MKEAQRWLQRKANSDYEHTLDINSLFENELKVSNEDLRRQAAETMFHKLRPSNKVSVEQFIAGIKQHRDVWAVVSTMGIVDFADTILGDQTRTKAAPSGAGPVARFARPRAASRLGYSPARRRRARRHHARCRRA
jgi:hypothetical protein